jgi:dTMP kinase
VGADNLRSVFISFEGIDRSGKTTQAKMLANALGAEALLVREPGGTPAAERIRDLVKDPELELSPIAETLLFGAARAELVERVVRPALADGRVVICDRYIDSTVAYQGGARGLGIERIERLNDWIADGLWPDVTFLLEVPPPVARGRGGEDDRFEREGEDLQRAVAAAYEDLAERHAGRYVRIDASRPKTQVHEEVLAEVEARRAGAVR